MGRFRTIDDLRAAVERSDQRLLLCTGRDLRDVGQESRLKMLARERIQDRLRAEGLVAIPDVPQYQDEPVYVAKIGSTAAALATALDEPNESGLRLLSSAAEKSRHMVHARAAVDEAQTAIDAARQAVLAIIR